MFFLLLQCATNISYVCVSAAVILFPPVFYTREICAWIKVCILLIM